MAQSTPTSALGFQDFFTTTLDGSITASDTTISLANAPTPTMGYLVIEPDSSTNREIIMYTSVSGNDVICGSVDDRGIGGTTAKTHSSGAIVKMNTVSDMFEALQSGRGLAADFAIPSGSVDPEDLVASTGTSWVWQDFTPSFTNWTIGTGGSAVTTAKYAQHGKTVFFRITTILGTSGQSVGAGVTFNLPVTAATGTLGVGSFFYFGFVQLEDAGNASYFGSIRMTSTTAAQVTVDAAGATYRQPTALSSTVPFTWGAGDGMTILGMYEAA